MAAAAVFSRNIVNKHYSISQLLTYMKCPLHFYFRYVEGLRVPMPPAVTLGKAVHSALETNFRQKIQSRKDLPINDVLDSFSDSFDAVDEETLWSEDESPEKVRGDGANLIRAYMTGLDWKGEPMTYRELNPETRKYERKRVEPLAPKIQPLLVEEPFEVRFDNDVGYTFVGRMDLVDDKGRIRDTKTTAKSPTQDMIDNDLQLTAYALGFRVKTGKIENGLMVDAIVKNSSPKLVSIETKRSREDIDRLMRILSQIANAVERGVFYCGCSNLYCGGPVSCQYWDLGKGKGCRYGA